VDKDVRLDLSRQIGIEKQHEPPKYIVQSHDASKNRYASGYLM
jgi:hypothetical protein